MKSSVWGCEGEMGPTKVLVSVRPHCKRRVYGARQRVTKVVFIATWRAAPPHVRLSHRKLGIGV